MRANINKKHVGDSQTKRYQVLFMALPGLALKKATYDHPPYGIFLYFGKYTSYEPACLSGSVIVYHRAICEIFNVERRIV